MSQRVTITAGDTFTMADDAVIVSPEEIRAAIDAEARDRMGISGDTFIAKWQRGDLPDTAATSDIGILVRLLDL